MKKLTSRKFWISCAAFLASIGTSIAGITTETQWVTIVGIVCAMLSAAIYAACEAYVDKAAVNEETVTNTAVVTTTPEGTSRVVIPGDTYSCSK